MARVKWQRQQLLADPQHHGLQAKAISGGGLIRGARVEPARVLAMPGPHVGGGSPGVDIVKLH